MSASSKRNAPPAVPPAASTPHAEPAGSNKRQLAQEVRELKQLRQQLEKENKELRTGLLQETERAAQAHQALELKYQAALKKIADLEAGQARTEGREAEADRETGAPPQAAVSAAEPWPPAENTPRLGLRLSKAFLDKFDTPRSMISSADNFRVMLGVALEPLPGQHHLPLQFRIRLQAKSLDTEQRTDLADLLTAAEGPETTIGLPVQGRRLAPGTYRLEATLVCQQQADTAPLATAFAEGHLLGIYEAEPEPLVNMFKRVQQLGW